MRFNFETLQFEDLNHNGEKLAIAGSDGELTWKAFKEKTDQLCEVFQKAGIPQGHPVCIYGHKGKMFPVAILACIKSKLPYVPIDTVMPAERVKKIKASTGSEVLICSGNAMPGQDFNVVIDNTLQASTHNKPEFKECYRRENDPLVFMLFTSGSTGEPKGVMITYEAVKSFVKWLKRDYGFSSSSVFMNQASFSFDISLIDLFGALDNGATIVLNDTQITRNPLEFIKRTAHYKCSVWVSTPSFIYMYLTEPSFNENTLPHLSSIFLLGENLPARTVKKIYEKFPGCKVYNAYGPTEATVATTIVEITLAFADKYASGLPIGYSKYDGKILIQNAENDPAKEGEIIIVGEHVSIGYLKNEKLSSEKFYLHEGVRAYKTGDYGYYKDDMVFFNGRKDEQVKLNGFRIELGEITSKLLDIPGIDDAVTIPLISGGQVKKIVSFIKTKEPATKSSDELTTDIIDYLSKALPIYMVPSDFRFIKEFPINSSHKIDKLKLQELYMQ
jgi:D-alanine--poly(phosphoribitol) ligase subunit 1